MLTEEKYGITSDQVMGQGVKTTLGISNNEFALSDKVCSNRSDIIQTIHCSMSRPLSTTKLIPVHLNWIPTS